MADKTIIEIFKKVLDFKDQLQDFISLSFFIVASHNDLDETDFENQYKVFFSKQLNAALSNIAKLNTFDKDLYGAITKSK